MLLTDDSVCFVADRVRITKAEQILTRFEDINTNSNVCYITRKTRDRLAK
jgi:hypothetical protein